MFQRQSADYLRYEFLPKIEAVIRPLTIDQIWWRPNEASNSIGNLMLHLSGNVRQWISGGVARGEVTRDRPAEFARREPIDAETLLIDLKLAVDEACRIIEGVSDAELADVRSIQGFETTVLGAIYHVVEHFSMHTGQIILIAKMQTGTDAGFYRLRNDGTPEPVFTKRRAFSRD